VVSKGGLALFHRLLAFWRRKDPPAWSPLSRPLSESTLALVCSNAYMTEVGHRVGPGEHECRFRTIPAQAQRDEPTAHPAGGLDLALMEEERLLPVLDRARQLVESGRVGRLSPQHLSLSGAVITPSRVVEETNQTAVRQLTDDRVDVVLLVPT
jgi:hypothetical protein